MLWFSSFDFMGNLKKTFNVLKIQMTILTFTGIIVSLIMVIQYFNRSESWEVDDASKVAILCFYIFDMVINLVIQINVSCCQMEIVPDEE